MRRSLKHLMCETVSKSQPIGSVMQLVRHRQILVRNFQNKSFTWIIEQSANSCHDSKHHKCFVWLKVLCSKSVCLTWFQQKKRKKGSNNYSKISLFASFVCLAFHLAFISSASRSRWHISQDLFSLIDPASLIFGLPAQRTPRLTFDLDWCPKKFRRRARLNLLYLSLQSRQTSFFKRNWSHVSRNIGAISSALVR